MLNQCQKQFGKSLSIIAALLTAVSFSTFAPAAKADLFYVPPESPLTGAPGDVVRSRVAKAGPPTARGLANAWHVMYQSTNVLGEPNVVTGTVLVPKNGNPATMPIVGMGPGTAGPALRCAPSQMINKGAYYEQPAINDMLERGYAVAVTDYEGYQPAPKTTYIIGKTMGAALIDIVRAARNLPGTGLSADAPVVFRGYSQGGGAAMWAGQMQPGYAPEMNLVGVAGGGVPANLARVALPLDGKEGFGVMFYALVGQDNAYPELSMEGYLNDEGQAAVTAMNEGMCILELLQQFAGKSINELSTVNPLISQRFQRIAENELGKEPIMVPVFQFHEVADGLVEFTQAKDLRDVYCAQGVEHTWKTYDSAGETGVIRHINMVYQANDAVNAFIEKRLAGAPGESNCL